MPPEKHALLSASSASACLLVRSGSPSSKRGAAVHTSQREADDAESKACFSGAMGYLLKSERPAPAVPWRKLRSAPGQAG